MKRVTGILSLMLAVSLLGAPDVRAFSLVGVAKTSGPAVTATVVIDVTSGGAPRGNTSIRVQKASQSAAVSFTSSVVSSTGITCGPNATDFPAATNVQFALCPTPTGGVGACLISGLIGDPVLLNALLGNFFADPTKAAITDTDYAVCTTQGTRQILSFTAVLQSAP